jgi:hypothetical protein
MENYSDMRTQTEINALAQWVSTKLDYVKLYSFPGIAPSAPQQSKTQELIDGIILLEVLHQMYNNFI